MSHNNSPATAYALRYLVPLVMIAQPTEEETEQAVADAIEEEKEARAEYATHAALRTASGSGAPALILSELRDRMERAGIVRALILRSAAAE